MEELEIQQMAGESQWKNHTLSYSAFSHQGMVRKANEDAYLVLPERGLFCVSDGMGGHENGVIASRMTLNGVERYCSFMDDPDNATLPPGLMADNFPKEPTEGMTMFANSMVHREAAGRTMGATLVGLYFDEQVTIFHVGDSRVYRMRQGGLEQLTEDHSFVNELYVRGKITKEEMRSHPRRNVITKAIGTDINVSPSIQNIEVAFGDLFLICSDGLTGMLDDEAITAVISNGNGLAGISQSLVEQANGAGGKDNITVILVSVQ